ncbi:Chromobox protein homolog hpl-2 [Caenorhabditis elegans]|uniref:Chromobox protein homolog hpl-2 n=1 Tax=Caenorhabditis elegans TaxID=6239 RepID=CBXH2_CAEEL|nr:Chromobox protein homolog hpl-2 [Caenorhabditis elegans]G5EDE2.1 RecName: Full=Chromobox protein homolog hpl-2; AltName: Full=HP1-like heterochromatin protein 2 [Caenorhabditis elegans]AAD21197.1 chromo-domain protein [Caenorhabditis elegans]CAB07241.1 Chromobox protein homolog hpl-2 [Caenorhabditis elegans]|eukprot:NP_001022652.1 HP1 Like (heterochromatin protein) [Caenorhabditis elegans]
MSSKSTKRAKIEDPKDNVFMVEKVLDKRTGKAGRDEFLIQWQGFPESDSSWEPRENLQCVEMLDEFEREFSKREKPIRKRHSQKPEPSEDQADPEEDKDEKKETNQNDKFSLEGKQLKCIVGLTKGPGELHFLCKFSDDTARLLPAKEVNSRYPSQVIRYYESKLTIQDPKADEL